MYETIKKVIESGRFELADILKKIDTIWIQGDLTEEEKEKLVLLAREKANAENSFSPLQEQIAKAFEEIEAVKERVSKLENPEGEEPEQPADEYPEYTPPTGAHDAYYNGAKITYNGKKYDCIAPEGVAVVWPPDVMPSYWKEVTEEEEEGEENV